MRLASYRILEQRPFYIVKDAKWKRSVAGAKKLSQLNNLAKIDILRMGSIIVVKPALKNMLNLRKEKKQVNAPIKDFDNLKRVDNPEINIVSLQKENNPKDDMINPRKVKIDTNNIVELIKGSRPVENEEIIIAPVKPKRAARILQTNGIIFASSMTSVVLDAIRNSLLKSSYLIILSLSPKAGQVTSGILSLFVIDVTRKRAIKKSTIVKPSPLGSTATAQCGNKIGSSDLPNQVT